MFCGERYNLVVLCFICNPFDMVGEIFVNSSKVVRPFVKRREMVVACFADKSSDFTGFLIVICHISLQYSFTDRANSALFFEHFGNSHGITFESIYFLSGLFIFLFTLVAFPSKIRSSAM